MSETEGQMAATGTGGDPVALDLGLCKACGICIDLCPPQVFDRDGLGYPEVARPQDCTACLLCELHCPDFAIEIARRPQKRRSGAAAAQDDQRVRAAIVGQQGRMPDSCDIHEEV